MVSGIMPKKSEYLNSDAEFYKNCLWSDEGEPARDYLFSRGFKKEVLEEFSVGFCSKDGGYYSNRVLFPIFDCLGNVCGFSGRALPDTSHVKYLNSPESAVFSKSRLLFGLNRNRQQIFIKNKVIFVEGFTDVIALAQQGCDLAVAGMGIALTDPQLSLISRYTRNLYLCFDADVRGNNALRKSIVKAKAAGFNVIKVELPEGKDPADLL